MNLIDAKKKIKIAKETKSTNLNLTFFNGYTLPEEIRELQQLKSIVLSQSTIEVLPGFLLQMPALTDIYCYNCNKLKDIGEVVNLHLDSSILSKINYDFRQIKGLRVRTAEYFDLSPFKNLKELVIIPEVVKQQIYKIADMQLESLTIMSFEKSYLPLRFPTDFTSASLKKLVLSNLQISQLNNLPDLKALFITNCKIENFVGFNESQQLVNFMAYNAELSAIPPAIYNSLNLKSVILNNNQISKISKNISNLKELEILNLAYNMISHVPQELSELPKLHQLDLSRNPLKTPPQETFTSSGYHHFELRQYYALKKEQGIEKMYEAKVLMIGEGEVGKSTLANKIINKDYLLEKGSTDGIQILNYDFKTSEGKDFHANIWDFGGQSIYHSTHQFFLSTDSLYILVDDGRKNKTDFHYWLKVVDLLSSNSPLMLVQNRREDKGEELDENRLRGEYNNLVSPIFYSNLDKNENLERIVKEVKHQLEALPHIGLTLPAYFSKVRKALEENQYDYISQQDFFKICADNSMPKKEDALYLSALFHKIGVFIHYKDDPVLKHIVILKHTWATDAVYNVCDTDLIKNVKKGRFSKADASEVWNTDKYKDSHDELLQLMKKFSICYQVGQTDEYVVPHLLPITQPIYQWEESGNIIIRYNYTFMPKGMVNRFTVEMYKFINDQNQVWKEGVVLLRDDTLAEVIEQYHYKEIRVRVYGKNKKEFLALIMDKFNDIHANYPKLKYEKLIPCNCKRCKETPLPHFYKYDKLKEFLSNKRAKINCEEAPYQEVNVQSLIDDITYRSDTYWDWATEENR